MGRRLVLVAAIAFAWGCTEDNGEAGGDGAGSLDASASVDGGAGGEGGAGGAGGGDAGAAPDDAAGGAGGAGGGDAAAPADPCAEPCARFVDCAVDRCDGYEDADRGTIDGLCQAA
jgi:hypothetical protein